MTKTKEERGRTRKNEKEKQEKSRRSAFFRSMTDLFIRALERERVLLRVLDIYTVLKISKKGDVMAKSFHQE